MPGWSDSKKITAVYERRSRNDVFEGDSDAEGD